MFYEERQMEEKALMETAAKMCAAARTAPKTKGVDDIITLVLTGSEKVKLADKMDEVYLREFGETEGHYVRDAKNLRASGAVVLIGVKKSYNGLPHCSFCGFKNCGENKKNGGRCAFNTIDLGIAIGSAVSVAADNRVDSRVMFSIGKVFEEMDFIKEKDILWQGIPISISGKSPYFDRVKKK